MEMRPAVALFFRTFPHAKLSILKGMSENYMEENVYVLKVSVV